MNRSAANLVELFSSVQGEGVLVGRRQVFLRFSGCNLDCRYCDTVHDPSDTCSIEKTPGHGDFIRVPNPVSLQAVLDRLSDWKIRWPLLHHSLSITGGEPLRHAEILAEFLPTLREVLPIYLETNGTLPEQLRVVIDHVDMISMDIKLPSTSGHHNLSEIHKVFLETANKKLCYVKAVVGMESSGNELAAAANLIASINRSMPFVLQPVTGQLGEPGLGAHLLRLQEEVASQLEDVRVIPQTHVLLNVL